MTSIPNVSELISLWPKRQALADDLTVTVDRVYKWARTNAIPAKYHAGVLEAARERGFNVDAENLVEMHRPRSESA